MIHSHSFFLETQLLPLGKCGPPTPLKQPCHIIYVLRVCEMFCANTLWHGGSWSQPGFVLVYVPVVACSTVSAVLDVEWSQAEHIICWPPVAWLLEVSLLLVVIGAKLQRVDYWACIVVHVSQICRDPGTLLCWVTLWAAWVLSAVCVCFPAL